MMLLTITCSSRAVVGE